VFVGKAIHAISGVHVSPGRAETSVRGNGKNKS